MKNNIVLIGFMGCGKSSVGAHLADFFHYPMIDTDQWIEKEASQTISDIFATNGETYFRQLEREAIVTLSESLSKTIVSTGGGLPIQEGNGDLLKKVGLVVYLKVSKETVLQRLKGDTTRPLLQGENVEQKVEELLNFRSPIYEKTADVTVVVDGKDFSEIVQEIADVYRHKFHEI